jgi:hypothetical protein
MIRDYHDNHTMTIRDHDNIARLQFLWVFHFKNTGGAMKHYMISSSKVLKAI